MGGNMQISGVKVEILPTSSHLYDDHGSVALGRSSGIREGYGETWVFCMQFYVLDKCYHEDTVSLIILSDY
jgi:hypothetical protein